MSSGRWIVPALSAGHRERESRWPTAHCRAIRNLVLAIVIAVVLDRLDTTGADEGLLLGLVLWVGFPVVLLAGSVFHEKVPPMLAAIHAGDWLVKLLAVTATLAVWQ